MRPTGTLTYLSGPREVTFEEYDVPPPEPGAVVTEVAYANVCGSDIHTWKGNHPTRTTGRMGHEGTCRVLERGDGVETDAAGEPIADGDVVSPVYFIPCGTCTACRDGHTTVCRNLSEHTVGSPDDHPHFTGTFATHYYIHPDQHFYKVPDDVDPRIAAAANCALSQVLYGMDQAGIGYGDTVVIQGAGGLGLNAIAVANERGAEAIVIDGVNRRLDRARAFDAAHTIDLREHDTVEARAERVRDLTDGVGADHAIEVTGVPDAFREGPALIRPGGGYLEMGNVMPGGTTAFDPASLTRNGIDVTAALHYEPWYLRKALAFLADVADDYPYADLVDETFALEDVEEAIAKSDRREVTRATLAPNP